MSQHSETAEPPVKPKRIILFSDGTGNSSGKLNKTNVWRMYVATDFGVPEDIRHIVQIGRYDNGVGTSTFRPLAVLQGVFGWGLVRNVLSLYLFLCQNYRPGDEVCLFGFSRGAFTVRVLANLIDKEGIISSTHADALGQLTKDAYRHYRRDIAPPMPPMRWIVPLLKRLQLSLIALVRIVFRQDRYYQAEKHEGRVDFLGVWDTVDAYGGPIIELVRAVDNWIMRISFRDSELPACVKVARHALALDDERDSFQPRPWNEADGTSRETLQQVWFAGMHSDVGGGYPEQGLAHVSLCWMMEHAILAGIRLRDEMVRDALEERDAFGRLHDSRAGLAGYYRYQPRDIGGYIEPPQPGTEQMTDPKLPEDEGLVTPILVHESVFQRIVFGTDGYAPITIPKSYKIVTDSLKMGKSGAEVANAKVPTLATKITDRLLDTKLQKAREKARQKVLDQVWWRRIFYFAIVLVSLAGATMPIWTETPWIPHEREGGLFSLLALPFQSLGSVVPDALAAWPASFAERPVFAWVVILAVFALFQLSAAIERRLRGFSRAHWRAVIDGRAAKAPPGAWVRRLRTSRIYQGWLLNIKWHALPALFGVLMVLLLASAVATLVVQLQLSGAPPHSLACAEPPGDQSASASRFETSRPCTLLPVTVEKGRTYRLLISVPTGDEWRDGSIKMTPEGKGMGRLVAAGADFLVVGWRRVLNAGWMQPLIFITPDRPGEPMKVQPVTVRPGRLNGAVVYAGEFMARGTGRIGIGVNDAIAPVPLRADSFYRAKWLWSESEGPLNRGRGCVELWEETSHPQRRFEPKLRCPSLAGVAGHSGPA